MTLKEEKIIKMITLKLQGWKIEKILNKTKISQSAYYVHWNRYKADRNYLQFLINSTNTKIKSTQIKVSNENQNLLSLKQQHRGDVENKKRLEEELRQKDQKIKEYEKKLMDLEYKDKEKTQKLLDLEQNNEGQKQKIMDLEQENSVMKGELDKKKDIEKENIIRKEEINKYRELVPSLELKINELQQSHESEHKIQQQEKEKQILTPQESITHLDLGLSGKTWIRIGLDSIVEAKKGFTRGMKKDESKMLEMIPINPDGSVKKDKPLENI